MEIAVVRDLLDKQLVDREGEPLGRVDGIIMAYGAACSASHHTLRAGRADARTATAEAVSDALAALARRLTPRGSEPYRIEVGRIVHLGRTIKIDIHGTRSAARETERWIRDHMIARIPGS